MQQLPEHSDHSVVNPSQGFKEAISLNSHYELDWIWFATRLTCATEQEYCFRRALYINPKSKVAKQVLHHMKQRQSSGLITHSILNRLTQFIF